MSNQDMSKPHKHIQGEVYHVFTRGIDKREIFLNQKDKKRFQKMLYAFNGTKVIQYRDIEGISLQNIDRGEPFISIGAYSITNNQVHFLVSEKVEGGMCKFFHKLFTAYSMYFNRRNNRRGSLFEGTYRCSHCPKDDYLRCLFAYIHIKPIKYIDSDWVISGIKDLKSTESFLNNYAFSSYLDFCGKKRDENFILDQDHFSEFFKKNKFTNFISDWIENKVFISKHLDKFYLFLLFFLHFVCYFY